MSSSLNELNQRLTQAGLRVDLNADRAEQLKAVASRDRILKALARVETHGDNGARAYLVKTFESANLTLIQDTPENLPEGAKNTPTEQTEARQAQNPPEQTTRAPGQATRGKDNRPNHADKRLQHHIYGRKAALTFEYDTTVSGKPTVALDAAIAVGERKYDWGHKIRLQFTVQELPVVTATLLGVLPECQFSNHGPENDKGFEIKWQGERTSFFVRVWQGKGNLRAVPMTREDAFYAAQLLLRALQAGSPARMDTTGIIATLRAFYNRK